MRRGTVKVDEMVAGSGEDFQMDLDKFIARLLRGLQAPGSFIPITEEECFHLCEHAYQIIMQEPMLIELESPLKIVGDLHGQFYDLLRLFEMCNHPPAAKYLFLGDYVDRGPQSLEIVCLVFAYKVKYPQQVTLLRGNHESDLINRVYGFREELRTRFGKTQIRKYFLQVFNVLPVAAIVEKSIFCVHGGLSPELLADDVTDIRYAINSIPRPCEVPRRGLLCDLLWADPEDLPETGEDPSGWSPNNRGCSWQFGYDVVDKFLEKFGFDLVVRAHQVVEDGYEFYDNRKLITVFSAPNYCNQFDNAGGVFVVKKVGLKNVLEGGFQIIKPEKRVNYVPYTKNTTLLDDDD